MVYSSIVLMYGAESWAIKEPIIKKVETFQNWCMLCILGVSQTEQRIRHLTSSKIRIMFGNERPIVS